MAALIAIGLLLTQLGGTTDPAASNGEAETASANELTANDSNNTNDAGSNDSASNANGSSEGDSSDSNNGNGEAIVADGDAEQVAGPEAELKADAIEALEAEGLGGVNVRMDGDSATLSGSVTNATERAAAEEAVNSVTGIETVTNSIIVTGARSASPEPAESPAAEAETGEPSYNG